jgi:acylphosphatase
MIRKQIIVKGRVQGVFYRAFAVDAAVNLGLTGYVRNLSSGDVEVVAEGEDQKIQELIKELRDGPPLARVREIVVNDDEWTGEFNDFRKRY